MGGGGPGGGGRPGVWTEVGGTRGRLIYLSIADTLSPAMRPF